MAGCSEGPANTVELSGATWEAVGALTLKDFAFDVCEVHAWWAFDAQRRRNASEVAG